MDEEPKKWITTKNDVHVPIEEGETTIEVNSTLDNRKMASEKKKIAVCPAFTSDLVLGKRISVVKDATYELNINFGEGECSKDIYYESSNDEIMTVSSEGEIKGIKAGSAILTVRKGTRMFSVPVYVTNEFVIIHDGARPLIKPGVISQIMDSVIHNRAVSVMTKTTDTIKEVDENGRIIKTIDRSKLYNTQTPQAFKTELIKNAHEKLHNKHFTDDASMLEYLDIPVYVVIGSYTNIKITTKSDLDFAKLYI